MCGLPCAGKTSLARQIERERRALRLTPDEWQIQLFGMDLGDAAHDERHMLIEALLWDVAARVLALGVDAILDFGFWSRSEREDYRARAARLGASSELHALIVPEDELLTRLEVRNAQPPPGAFVISSAQLRTWYTLFEPPAANELQRRER